MVGMNPKVSHAWKQSKGEASQVGSDSSPGDVKKPVFFLGDVGREDENDEKEELEKHLRKYYNESIRKCKIRGI